MWHARLRGTPGGVLDGKGSHWGHLVIVAAALGVALGVFERAILVAGPLSGDDAYHSLWGLRIAEDIRQGQWLGLAYDTYRQVYWPPLHSWYLAALFLLWGPRTRWPARAACWR